MTDPPDPPDEPDLVEMQVGGIVMDPKTEVPVLILRDISDPRRYLPVYIGGLEAASIATVLAGVELPRPLTHDLTMTIVAKLGHRVCGAIMTKLVEGTFYAELTLASRDDTFMTLDARPSDCIALALRANAPIWVARPVLDEAGAVAEAPEPTDEPSDVGSPIGGNADASETVDTATDLGAAKVFGEGIQLEDLEPDDFGKYKM